MTRQNAPYTMLHVTETGRGAPVVLLHGSASNSKQWTGLTDYLKGRFHVIAPDMPGYGKSDPVAGTGPNRMTETAEILIAMMDFEFEPVHLVGHSFGAAVALKIASLRPDLVQSLALIEPAAFSAFWSSHGHAAPETRRFAEMGARVEALIAKGACDAAMQSFIDFWNGDGAWDNTSEKLKARLLPCLPYVLEDFNALKTDKMDGRDLAGITCPVQILRGANSPEVMATLTRHLLEQLPFATEMVFPDAGHMLPLTDPHLSDPAVGGFLDQVDRLWHSCKKPLALAA